MQHFRSFEEAAFQHAFATIGTFDGVHRGHQAILVPLVEAAHASQNPAVVVTFSPHPMQVLRGIRAPMCLTTADERAVLLGSLGIDAVITLTFDQALAALSAEEFMRPMNAHLGLRQLWVGHDFALGRNRQGDIAMLRELGKHMGYTVHVIDEITLPVDGSGVNNPSDTRISSSRIRALVRDGGVEQAALMLGRPYSMRGTVMHGDGRGRGLGFPTANVAFPQEKILPAYGVYVTWVWVAGRRLPSVTSVGVRPTFANSAPIPTVEAYLIDFDEDLYGQTMQVDFLTFLRPELKFNSVQALIDQMQQDTQHAREALRHAL